MLISSSILFFSTLGVRECSALSADPSTNQVSFGDFNPYTYLYFEGQTWPKDRPSRFAGLQNFGEGNGNQTTDFTKRDGAPEGSGDSREDGDEDSEEHNDDGQDPGFWMDRSQDEDIIPNPEPPHGSPLMMGLWQNLLQVLENRNDQLGRDWTRQQDSFMPAIRGNLVMWWGLRNPRSVPWRGDPRGPAFAPFGRDRPGDLTQTIPQAHRAPFEAGHWPGNVLIAWLAWRIYPPDRRQQRRYSGFFAMSNGNWFLWYRILRRGDPRISRSLGGGAPPDSDARPDTEHPDRWSGARHTPFQSPVVPQPPPPPDMMAAARQAQPDANGNRMFQPPEQIPPPAEIEGFTVLVGLFTLIWVAATFI